VDTSDGVIGDGRVLTAISAASAKLTRPQQIMTVIFEDKSVDYAFDMLGELEPPYAMTVICRRAANTGR
jgi:hypothetical protein